MRHHNKNRKFGRTKDQRHALLKSLAVSLIERGKIRTTEAKAKELRPFVERLITTGRTGTLASRRLVSARLGNTQGTKKVMGEIADKYKDRKGGYTRIVKLPRRMSDGSKMAIIELV
jgi:large subunit ribosomal protein L17